MHMYPIALLAISLAVVAACSEKQVSSARISKNTVASGPHMIAIEPSLFGVTLGSTVASLEQLFPKIYRHALSRGEVLYEACNQKEQIVFTFTEEPWSPTHVTYISARAEPDVTVCRDQNGALPDFGITPETPRHVGLGATRANVLAAYGAPFGERDAPGGRHVLEYRRSDDAPNIGVDAVRLYITLVDDEVKRMSLQGKMPGAKAPF